MYVLLKLMILLRYNRRSLEFGLAGDVQSSTIHVELSWLPLNESREKTAQEAPLSINTERIQPADIGLPTGNGTKLSCSQAQVGQATCLAVA